MVRGARSGMHCPWYRMRETVPFSVAPSYGGALGWLRLRGLRGLIEIGWKGTRDRRVAPKNVVWNVVWRKREKKVLFSNRHLTDC